MKKLIALFPVLFFLNGFTQPLTVFEKKLFIHGKDTLRYRIMYPENYKAKKAYPLVMFLHGSGERGNDNEAQLIHGGTVFADANFRTNFSSIVIFPQCPKDSSWSKARRNTNTDERVFPGNEVAPMPQQLVKQLMDSLLNSKKIEKRKIYLGGLSMGGFGTYDLLIRYPDYFAASFPICGGTNVDLFMQRCTQIPIWIFHGALDKTVIPQYDRELIKKLNVSGSKIATYTEYPTMGHNSWDSALIEPKLFPWLFAQKKKK